MIDICSKGDYPACEFSNFTEHHFVLDEVEIKSMEMSNNKHAEFLKSIRLLGEKK